MKAPPAAIDAAATGRGCNQTARKTEGGRIRQDQNPLGGNASPFTKHDPDVSLLFEPSVTIWRLNKLTVLTLSPGISRAAFGASQQELR
jgi:hypothetical protein